MGPARSIFYMCGFHDLVAMIDDPAYVLEDEVVSIPLGCSPASFFLERYFEEGKVPKSRVLHHMGFTTDPGVAISMAFSISTAVTSTVATH